MRVNVVCRSEAGAPLASQWVAGLHRPCFGQPRWHCSVLSFRKEVGRDTNVEVLRGRGVFIRACASAWPSHWNRPGCRCGARRHVLASEPKESGLLGTAGMLINDCCRECMPSGFSHFRPIWKAVPTRPRWRAEPDRHLSRTAADVNVSACCCIRYATASLRRVGALRPGIPDEPRTRFGYGWAWCFLCYPS